jgi:hypothetical protein
MKYMYKKRGLLVVAKVTGSNRDISSLPMVYGVSLGLRSYSMVSCLSSHGFQPLFLVA